MQLTSFLIRTLSALLFLVFGTVAAFAVPRDWTPASYPAVAQELSAQPVNLTNNARAPPHTSAINLDDFGVTGLSEDSLIGLGDDFTIANLAEDALDNVLTAGMTSVAYGADFGDAFTASTIATIVNAAAADLQTGIGDIAGDLGGEGSLGHVLLHSALGCTAAALQDSNCAAGALGAGTTAILAGVAQSQGLSTEQAQEYLAEVELLSGLAAALGSEGDLAAAQLGGQIGASGFENNYLTHAEREEYQEILFNCLEGADPRACDRKAELDDVSNSRAQQLRDCVGDYSQNCQSARANVRLAAADFMQVARTGPYGIEDDLFAELYLLERHMVFVDAARFADINDSYALPAETTLHLTDPDAIQIATGTPEQVEDAVKLAVALGTIVLAPDAARRVPTGKTLDEARQADETSFGATNRGYDLVNPGTRPGATDAEAGGASYYDQYKKADGSGWDWPENLGFAGTPTEATMHVGTRLDRYGSADGSFMSPAGTPLEQRAMAPGSAAEPLHTYEVTKPLPVIQGEVAPAFGQAGGGTQMLPNLSERVNVDWLVRNGYLREVN